MKLTAEDDAPFFEGVDQDGETHSLEDYSGKYLLLYFYPRDNTSGCTKEACAFRDNYDELSNQMEIVGVSPNSKESHIKFRDKYDLPFTLLADRDREIIKAYGANGLIFPKRVSFLIDTHGTIKKIYENVDVKNHAEEILDDIAELK